MERRVETEGLISVRVGDDDIVRLSWAPGLEITGELAAEAMRIVDELNGPVGRAMLVTMTGTAALSRSARTVFSQPCSVTRLALLGRSAVDRVIANFAVGVNRHPMPMRFFTDEAAALAWLDHAAARR